MSDTKKDPAEVLNGLIEGELSAVETYEQALKKVGEDPLAGELVRLETEHREALALLQEKVVALGGIPAVTSGVWGTFAKAVEGAAKLFGNASAIKALKEGEEHGIRRYRKALEHDSLDAPMKELIRGELLPKTEEHIGVLDRFLP